MVVGGAGFLGRALVRRLCVEGARVRVLDRVRGSDRGELVQGDLGSAEVSARALDGIDLVFIVAGNSDPRAKGRTLRERDLEPLLVFLSQIGRRRVERVLFASSGGTVYGEGRGRPFREEDGPRPVTDYGRSRQAMEEAVLRLEADGGPSCRILRMATVFGPAPEGRAQGVVAAFVRRALRGERLELRGEPHSVRDYVHVEDVAEAFRLAAVDGGEHRVYNVGTGRGTRLDELAALVRSRVPSRSELAWEPAAETDLVWNVLSVERARNALSWRPRWSLAAGVDDLRRRWESA